MIDLHAQEALTRTRRADDARRAANRRQRRRLERTEVAARPDAARPRSIADRVSLNPFLQLRRAA